MAEWSPSAPAWVWSLGLKPGPWRVLIALWSFADHGSEGEIVVYPGHDSVADRLGIDPRTVRTQVRWLLNEGWIKSEPGHKRYRLAVRLAWREPFEVEGRGSSKTTQPILVRGSDDHTQPIRRDDATDPSKTPNRSAPTDQTITHTSQPHNYPTDLPHTETEPEQAAFTLELQEAKPSDLAGDLRAVHERLAIEAHRHHGHPARGGRPRGQLPKRGSKAAKDLDRRITEAIDGYGFETCVAVVEWRSAEWRAKKSQLARPSEQTWSDKAIKHVLRKIDEGADHNGTGKPPDGVEVIGGVPQYPRADSTDYGTDAAPGRHR